MRFNRWKYWLAVILCVSFLYKEYGMTKKRIKRSKDFSLEKIHSSAHYKLKEPVQLSPDGVEQANAILSQPFFFFGSGKQCYAFLSQDGKYVLKFFQQDRFRVNSYTSFTLLPDSFLSKKLRKQKAKMKEDKREQMLMSFELAKCCVEEETGVFYVHLNPTKNKHRNVSLLDARGNLISIPLDKVQFALQYRAQLLKPTLIALMHEGKEEEAKRRVEQVFALLVRSAKKGIQDSDGALIRNNNVGFLEAKAVYIDIGKLKKAKGEVSRKSFEHDLRRLRPLRNWLWKNYPTLGEHFQACQLQAVEQFQS